MTFNALLQLGVITSVINLAECNSSITERYTIALISSGILLSVGVFVACNCIMRRCINTCQQQYNEQQSLAQKRKEVAKHTKKIISDPKYNNVEAFAYENTLVFSGVAATNHFTENENNIGESSSIKEHTKDIQQKNTANVTHL